MTKVPISAFNVLDFSDGKQNYHLIEQKSRNIRNYFSKKFSSKKFVGYRNARATFLRATILNKGSVLTKNSA